MSIRLLGLALRPLVDGAPDADAFWRGVKTNLRAANLRLLFVTDEIAEPRTQVVEFLNEQMRVRAADRRRSTEHITVVVMPESLSNWAGALR